SRFASETTSSPGTVYLQLASDVPDEGELIVDNRNAVPVHYSIYETAASLGDLETVTYYFKKITLRNNGALSISSNNTLIATNQIVVQGDPARTGFLLEGGELRVPANFKIENFFVGIRNVGKPASFDPEGSLTIGSEGTFYVDQLHTLNSDLVIGSGGVLTHFANLWSGARHYFKEEPEETLNKVNLTINGNLTIHNGAGIDVIAQGYPAYEGPGRASSVNNTGGSHGGRGGGATVTPAECYGSITDPRTLGSGGVTTKGGGAIILNVTGKIINNGFIKADANDGSYYTGAGGSINITTGTLEGDGPITADGASCTGNYPGGGGRVAIALNDSGADFNTYAGVISANSGTKSGMVNAQKAAPGTVYLRKPGQAHNQGILFIDNGDNTDASFTEISAYVTDTEVGDVVISDKTTLMLSTNQSLTINRNFTNLGKVAPHEKSSLIFINASSVSKIKGSSSLGGIKVTEPGKILEFEAGDTFSLAPDCQLILRGSSSSKVTLRSSAASDWFLNLDETVEKDVEYVNVKHSNASGGDKIIARNSTNSGNNTNWEFITVVPGESIVWTGTENSLWYLSENWNLLRAPVETDVIIIPAGCANYPVFDVDRTVYRLNMEPDAFIDLNHFNLTIVDSAQISGSIITRGKETLHILRNLDFVGGSFIPSFSTLLLEGTGVQNINLANLSFYRIQILNQTGSVIFQDGFTAERELLCKPLSGTCNLVFKNGIYAYIRDLSLYSTSGTVKLRSDSSGNAWNLAVSGYRSVAGVNVSDCNASYGLAILAESSVNAGNNQNWIFNPPITRWTGTQNTNFFNADNWSPAVVPGPGDRVIIDTAKPLISYVPISVLDLTIGGGSETPSVTINAQLNVTENLTILENGLLTLNQPSEIGNNLHIHAGGTLTHSVNRSVALGETNKLDLTILGNLFIDEDGKIDATGKGFPTKQGTGTAEVTGGASYGGLGDPMGATTYRGPCYGSVIAPTNIGSGGSGTAGGGAVLLKVTGETRVDGLIAADGGIGYTHTGAGGSINIQTGTLRGEGIIQTLGGDGTQSGQAQGSGAGGRIAIVLSGPGADYSSFLGAIQSYGGPGGYASKGGGAGTVYLEKATDKPRKGTVIIDEKRGNLLRVTEFPSAEGFTPRETDIATFRLRSSTNLRLTNDFTVGDIWLESSKAVLDLNSYTLHVNTSCHELGSGIVSNWGNITWLCPGTVLIFQ
ncbi:MAG: hypothetical protein GX811_07395, partial [Lentisphaerae bacterium]|nr:hypothetical protein [Lentisphaerota bacterium]